MARDYGSRRPVKQKRNARQQALGVAFSFLLGYLAATVFDVEKLTGWMNIQVLAHHEEKPQAPKPAPHQAQLPPKPKPKFEFYTLLANEKGSQPHAVTKSHENQIQQPTASVKVAEAKSLTTSQPNNASYMVQVASFKMRKDAEQMKALLTLKGYDVNVVSISKAQESWFRVVVGPYQSKVLAQQAQVTLAKNERLRGMVKSA